MPGPILTNVFPSGVNLDATGKHLLISSLQRADVSFAGAQQFSSGEPVEILADRRMLAKILADVIRAGQLQI
jgi:hypothetical protein